MACLCAPPFSLSSSLSLLSFSTSPTAHFSDGNSQRPFDLRADHVSEDLPTRTSLTPFICSVVAWSSMDGWMLSLGPPRTTALVVPLALVETVLSQTCTQPLHTSQPGVAELVLWTIIFQPREIHFCPWVELQNRSG